jgi:hypothetical protein
MARGAGGVGGGLFLFQGTFASIRSILRAIILIGKAYQGSTTDHSRYRIGARASLVCYNTNPSNLYVVLWLMGYHSLLRGQVLCAITPIQAIHM